MVTLRQSSAYATVARCALVCLLGVVTAAARTSGAKCDGAGNQLKYLWGDALSDPTDCIGPQGHPYPSAAIAKSFRSSSMWTGGSRSGRAMKTMDPHAMSRALLHSYQLANENALEHTVTRGARSNLGGYSERDSCRGTPARLCKTRYNTTAPMYGVSLTSGQPVTIVQKFPDLLQQVVFETCESSECDVVRGECTQTYVPYLFLVIPLGPVTLTGQDYVLVESGCVCKPKYAAAAASPSAEASAKGVLPRL